jgi:hypothetical protein
VGKHISLSVVNNGGGKLVYSAEINISQAELQAILKAIGKGTNEEREINELLQNKLLLVSQIIGEKGGFTIKLPSFIVIDPTGEYPIKGDPITQAEVDWNIKRLKRMTVTPFKITGKRVPRRRQVS